jgi:hypothetical protein
MIFLFFIFAESVIYFLDSNVHIRVFTNDERRNDSAFDLVWYEYGHLSSLTYGAHDNLWAFGAFDFKDYQVLSLDAECSLQKDGCEMVKEPHQHEPSAGSNPYPTVLSNTFKLISAIEVTKERLFVSYQSSSNDAWEVSRFDPDDGSLNGETIVPASAQEINGLTMDNTTVYYFTTSSAIKYQKLGEDGIHGEIDRPDFDQPRNIFWRKDMLWVLHGDGQAISHIDLKEFRETGKVEEKWFVNFTDQYMNTTDPPLFHIPAMTVTNESIFYMVEELTTNLTIANWTLHERSFTGKHWTNRMPNNTTRLPFSSGVKGEGTAPALDHLATFLSSSNSVMTTVVTPNLDKTDYEGKGMRIFIGIIVTSTIVTAMVVYIAVTAK